MRRWLAALSTQPLTVLVRFQVQRAYHLDNGKKVYDMAPKKVKKLIMSQENNEDKFFD